MPAESRPHRQEPEQELLAQMRQSLGLLQVAFDSASDAMVILDRDHTIRWANQTAADRFSRGLTATLISQSFADRIILLAPYGEARPLDARSLLLTQNAGDMRVRVKRVSDNPEHHAPLNNVSWKAITNTHEPFHLIAFRNLDPIEQALEKQRLFVQQLAHELRTPLAILFGSLRRLGRLVTAPSLAINALETAQSESLRLRTLVDNLMLLSDLDTALFPWSIQEQSIKHSIHQWIDHLPQHQQELISLKADPELKSVRLDSHALEIVLDQLLSNSLRFSDQSVSITIDIKNSRGGIDLLFKDKGLGITETAQDKIDSVFDRFQRLEQHRSSTREEGCGLGLTVVQELIIGMGGTVEILMHQENISFDNRGACILIHFPYHNPPTQSSTRNR